MMQCVAVCQCVLLLCHNVLQCDRRPLKILLPPKGLLLHSPLHLFVVCWRLECLKVSDGVCLRVS